MFVATIGSDPVGRPMVLIFRVMMIGAAGLAGAFFWGLWFEKPPEIPKPPQEQLPEIVPTVGPQKRKIKRTRLGTVRHPDGRVETMFEKLESEEE
jgi:hypothetical protein